VEFPRESVNAVRQGNACLFDNVKKSVSVALIFSFRVSSGQDIRPRVPLRLLVQRPNSPIHAALKTADELQALVAPIALYPDSLVAQILTGSTFPDQVAVADTGLKQNKS